MGRIVLWWQVAGGHLPPPAACYTPCARGQLTTIGSQVTVWHVALRRSTAQCDLYQTIKDVLQTSVDLVYVQCSPPRRRVTQDSSLICKWRESTSARRGASEHLGMTLGYLTTSRSIVDVLICNYISLSSDGRRTVFTFHRGDLHGQGSYRSIIGFDLLRSIYLSLLPYPGIPLTNNSTGLLTVQYPRQLILIRIGYALVKHVRDPRCGRHLTHPQLLSLDRPSQVPMPNLSISLRW